MSKYITLFASSSLVLLIVIVFLITSQKKEKFIDPDIDIVGGPNYEMRSFEEDLLGQRIRPIRFNHSNTYYEFMSHSSNGVDFKLVNMVDFGLVILSSYQGPTNSTTILMEIESDVILQMTCGNEYVLTYYFYEGSYKKYAVSIDQDYFLGKCSYGEEVLVELYSDNNKIFQDTFKYNIDNRAFDMDDKHTLDLETYKSDDDCFSDVFLSQYSSGYFSLEDIDIYVDLIQYKRNLEPIHLAFSNRGTSSIIIEYSDVEDDIMSILSDYEDMKVCTSSGDTFRNDDCPNRYVMDVHFLLEFELASDQHPYKKLELGFGKYNDKDEISVFIYGANENGSYGFLVSGVDNPKIIDFYNYLHNLYEQEILENRE